MDAHAGKGIRKMASGRNRLAAACVSISPLRCGQQFVANAPPFLQHSGWNEIAQRAELTQRIITLVSYISWARFVEQS